MPFNKIYFQNTTEIPTHIQQSISDGNIFKANVIKLLKDGVILDLKGKFITAKTDISLKIGQELILKFDGISKGQFILKKIDVNTKLGVREVESGELLKEIGIKPSETNLDILNKMLEYKLPVNKETFSKVMEILNKLKPEYQSLNIVMNYLKENVLLDFHIPFLIDGEQYNSRILVISEDEGEGNQPELNKYKIVFYIETRNLDTVKVELVAQKNSLDGTFYVEKGEIADFIKKHIYGLEKLLDDTGYSFCNMDVNLMPLERKSATLIDSKFSRIDIQV